MSKTRYIKTDFWSDSYIETLDPTEKLLFIYLFTNDRLDLCGIYEITLRKISFETGINEENLVKILTKFSEKWKIYYIDWYIYVANFTKHLQINPSVLLWIDRSKNLIPKLILESIDKLGTGCIQGGTLIPIPIPIPIPKPIPTITGDEVYTQAWHLSITHDEFTKLEKEFGMEKADELVQSVLNYRKNSKYKNLYLTAIKWGRAEKKKVETPIKTVRPTFNFLTWEAITYND